MWCLVTYAVFAAVCRRLVVMHTGAYHAVDREVFGLAKRATLVHRVTRRLRAAVNHGPQDLWVLEMPPRKCRLLMCAVGRRGSLDSASERPSILGPRTRFAPHVHSCLRYVWLSPMTVAAYATERQLQVVPRIDVVLAQRPFAEVAWMACSYCQVLRQSMMQRPQMLAR